mgnify:CR=1 FL=1
MMNISSHKFHNLIKVNITYNRKKYNKNIKKKLPGNSRKDSKQGSFLCSQRALKKRAEQRKVVLFEKIVYNILVLTPKQARKDYIYEHA